MFKLHYVDFTDRKILSEQHFDDFDRLRAMMTTLDNYGEFELICDLNIDNEERALSCKYQSHSLVTFDKETILKVYFKTELINYGKSGLEIAGKP